MIGNAALTCQANGEWTGLAPICEGTTEVGLVGERVVGWLSEFEVVVRALLFTCLHWQAVAFWPGSLDFVYV